MKRIVSLCTIMALLVALAAPSAFAADKTKEADKIYSQAMGLSKASKVAEALKLLDKAISLNPKKAEFYYDRGTLLKKSGNSSKAVSDFYKAVVLNPDKYFKKIFGGTMVDSNTYKNNFSGFTVSTKVVTVADPSTVSDIKTYLKSYKGDKVKNAKEVIEAATGGSITILDGATADQLGFASIAMFPDMDGDVFTSELLAKATQASFKKENKFKNVQEVVLEKISNQDSAYFDLDSEEGGVAIKIRCYIVNFGDCAYLMMAGGSDEEHKNIVVNDFIKTLVAQ